MKDLNFSIKSQSNVFVPIQRIKNLLIFRYFHDKSSIQKVSLLALIFKSIILSSSQKSVIFVFNID